MEPCEDADTSRLPAKSVLYVSVSSSSLCHTSARTIRQLLDELDCFLGDCYTWIKPWEGMTNVTRLEKLDILLVYVIWHGNFWFPFSAASKRQVVRWCNFRWSIPFLCLKCTKKMLPYAAKPVLARHKCLAILETTVPRWTRQHLESHVDPKYHRHHPGIFVKCKGV